MDSRPVSWYGVTFFRGNDGGYARVCLPRIGVRGRRYAGMAVGEALVVKGGFETRPYQIVGSQPFNTVMLNQ